MFVFVFVFVFVSMTLETRGRTEIGRRGFKSKISFSAMHRLHLALKQSTNIIFTSNTTAPFLSVNILVYDM